VLEEVFVDAAYKEVLIASCNHGPEMGDVETDHCTVGFGMSGPGTRRL